MEEFGPRQNSPCMWVEALTTEVCPTCRSRRWVEEYKITCISSQTIPLPSEDPSEEGWLLDVYYPSVKMSTYLVAVVVTWDYKSVESNLVEGGPITKVSIYSFRNELHPSTQKHFSSCRFGLLQKMLRPVEQIMQLLLGLPWSSSMKTPMPSSETPLDDKDNDHPFPRYSLSKMDMLSQIDQPAVAMEVWHSEYSFSHFTRIGVLCSLIPMDCWLTQTVQMPMTGICSPRLVYSVHIMATSYNDWF